MKTLIALGMIVLAMPAYADCQRSPFTGMVFCSEGPSVNFQNEEVSPPYQRKTQTVCETRRTFSGFDTTCHEE